MAQDEGRSNDPGAIRPEGNSAGWDEVLTADEVALELRCSTPHVYAMIRGEVKGVTPLPAIRMGRRIVVRRSALELWKRQNESTPAGANLKASPEVEVSRRMEGTKTLHA